MNPSINEFEKQVKQQITKTDTIWHIPCNSLVWYTAPLMLIPYLSTLTFNLKIKIELAASQIHSVGVTAILTIYSSPIALPIQWKLSCFCFLNKYYLETSPSRTFFAGKWSIYIKDTRGLPSTKSSPIDRFKESKIL